MDTYTVLKIEKDLVSVRYEFKLEKGTQVEEVELSAPTASLEKLEAAIVDHGLRLKPVRKKVEPDLNSIVGITKDLATKSVVEKGEETPRL